MSLLSCKLPKTTWGSGEGGYLGKLPKGLSYTSLFHRFASNSWDSGLGFQIGYESSHATQWSYNYGACGGRFTATNGILTSPSYPDYYPDSAECVYTISQPMGTFIVITFHHMDIEFTQSDDTGEITGDYLEIRDGSTPASPLLGKLRGRDVPTPFQSSQNQVWMKWGETFGNQMTFTMIECVPFQIPL